MKSDNRMPLVIPGQSAGFASGVARLNASTQRAQTLLQGMPCNVFGDVRLSDAYGEHEVQLVSMTSCLKPHHRQRICCECNPRQWHRNRRGLLLGGIN